MKYQIKVILKNKITWLIILFLCLVFVPAMFQIMQPSDLSQRSIQYERYAMSSESSYRSFGASIKIDPEYEANKEAYHAFHNYFKKGGEWYRELSRIYEDGKVSKEEKKRERMINNLISVTEMEVNANPREGRIFLKRFLLRSLKKCRSLRRR